MAKTFLQRNESYYERIIREAEKSPHAENYQKVSTALKKLVEITGKLRKPKHKMTPEEYENLTNCYKEVKTACEEYAQKKDTFGDFEKKRSGIVGDILKVVKKDLGVLVKCNPLEPGSLSEIMGKSRVHTIVLDKDTIKVTGAAQSSRYPISFKSGKKGFFTPKTYFNQDPEFKNAVDLYDGYFRNFPEECLKKLELLKTDEEFQKEFSRFVQEQPLRYVGCYKAPAKDNLIHLATLLGMGQSKEEVTTFFELNTRSFERFVDFTNELIGVANRRRIMNTTGIKKGDSISSRNCAMTEVAKMLKCRKILADSVPMKIVIGEEEIEGVFMENAEGSDINHLAKGDKLLIANSDSFESPEALQQIIDLQVLDFICGNTDRHRGNLFYKFEGDKPGKIKLVGIQGIDNDCAFGVLDFKKDRHMHLTHPEDMKYISKSMLFHLSQLTEERLKLNLSHYEISDEQIQAVWDRVGMVKNAVEKGLIREIDKDHWEKNPLNETKYWNNYLAKMQGMAEDCKEKYFRVNETDKKKIKYAKEVNSAIDVMMKNEDKIAALREQMKNAKSMIFDSSEYKLMAASFEEIEKITKDIKENYPNYKDAPDDKIDALREAYVKMGVTTDKYITLKKLVPATGIGEKRLDFAKGLRDFASDTLEELGYTFEKEKAEEVLETEKDDEMEL